MRRHVFRCFCSRRLRCLLFTTLIRLNRRSLATMPMGMPLPPYPACNTPKSERRGPAATAVAPKGAPWRCPWLSPARCRRRCCCQHQRCCPPQHVQVINKALQCAAGATSAVFCRRLRRRELSTRAPAGSAASGGRPVWSQRLAPALRAAGSRIHKQAPEPAKKNTGWRCSRVSHQSACAPEPCSALTHKHSSTGGPSRRAGRQVAQAA